MPVRLLTAYVEAIPHIRASSEMRAAEATAMGTGTLKDTDRQEVAARLRRELRKTVRRARSPKAIAAMATEAHITVKLV